MFTVGMTWQSCHQSYVVAAYILLIPAGDEYAQTRGGNNNWYGHDTKLTRFDWSTLEAVKDTFFRFYRCSPTRAFGVQKGDYFPAIVLIVSVQETYYSWMPL